MASDQKFVDFITDQIKRAGEITAKKNVRGIRHLLRWNIIWTYL